MNYDEITCSTCEGTGYVKSTQVPPKIRKTLEPETEPCPTCLGTKKINDGIFQCPDCKGAGVRFLQRDGELLYSCPDCNGSGKIRQR